MSRRKSGEEGFLLIALVVAIFLIALFMTIAAPTVARSLERDKELESEHRAQQYVRAIHNYYLKFNSYPTSIDQLLSQNNQHFLRQKYKDPLTGGDYRLIHSGEAKTQVKGFFGEPLQGTAQGSLGALAGSVSNLGGGAGAGGTAGAGVGASSSFGGGGFSLGSGSSPSPSPAPAPGGANPATGTGTGAASADGSGFGAGPTSSGATLGGTNATQFQGSKGTIVGVGSNASGHGLVEWNGSENIQDWEFLYDHRTWLMKQQVSVFGGSAGASGGGSFGTSPGASGAGSNPTSGAGTVSPQQGGVGTPATVAPGSAAPTGTPMSSSPQ